MKKIIWVILLLAFIPLVASQLQTLGTFARDSSVNLIQNCENSTYSNITRVVFPNSTNALTGENNMTKSGDDYTLTFNYTGTKGQYLVYGHCDENGVKTNWVYDFNINVGGVAESQPRTDAVTRSIYIVFGIAILLFVAFLYTQSPPAKWSWFIMSLIFLVTATNLVSASLSDAVVNPALENFFDFFAASSLYIYWAGFGLLAIIWMMTMFNTWVYKKGIENARRFGSA